MGKYSTHSNMWAVGTRLRYIYDSRERKEGGSLRKGRKFSVT
jgi:hypothetical protein